MNGIRFYQEFTDKSKRKPGGTVVAALVLNGSYWSNGTICYEALAAVFDWPNSGGWNGGGLQLPAPEVQAYWRNQGPHHSPGPV